MTNNNKTTVVLPTYNAEKTLMKTYSEIPLDIVDSVILVDDCSGDSRSIKYGLRVIFTCLKYLVHRLGIKRIKLFIRD